MKKFQKSLSLIMVLTLILCLASCGKEEPIKTDEKWREPFIEETKKEFVDKDGQFDYKITDWSGPSGYTIIIPENNSEIKKAAEKLKNFFDEQHNTTLLIATDKSPKSEKEIIVGKTNRNSDYKNLSENEIKVEIEGSNLIFSGGHDTMISSGIDKFIRVSTEIGKFITFNLKTDFTTEMLDGYKYVWGDEFEGNDIDFTKWCFERAMDSTTKMEMSYDKNVVDVEDGRLKMHAIRYYNPDRVGTEYRVPYSVSTLDNMNFTYGYAEIRARLPFFSGVWPSFWTRSTDKLKGTRHKNFMAEIDIFEVFGIFDVEPGIIKWYEDGSVTFQKEYTKWNSWHWDNEDTIMQEYHTYGWEWTPEIMTMYVDGVPYQTYDIINSYDYVDDMQGFHDPEYILFSNHIITDDSWQSGPIIENGHDYLPACFYIDYFRLYQKTGVGELYVADTNHEYSDRK